MKKPVNPGFAAIVALFLATGPALAGEDPAEPGTQVEAEDEGGGDEGGGDEGGGAEEETAEAGEPEEPDDDVEAKKPVSKASLLLPVSEVGAAVFLDGEEVGISPLPSLGGLTVGKHELTVKKDGFFAYAADVDIPVDGSVRHDVLLATSARKDVSVPPILKKWWLWTIVGAVVLTGAGVGIYFGTRPAEPDGVPMPPF